MQESGTDAKRVRLVEEFLLSRITPGSKDEMVMEAVRYMQGSKGAGFYDQSHFIKQFKTFTGITPENFFRGVK